MACAADMKLLALFHGEAVVASNSLPGAAQTEGSAQNHHASS
jgi:hypothetical protein